MGDVCMQAILLLIWQQILYILVTDTRNPVGLTHGQFSPRYFQVNQHYLYDKEYIYAGQNDVTKGWTVSALHYYDPPGIVELELKSLHLFSAISVRGCIEVSCLPFVMEGFIRNNTEHRVYDWIRLRQYFINGRYHSVSNCLFHNFYLWFNRKQLFNNIVSYIFTWKYWFKMLCGSVHLSYFPFILDQLRE